MLIKAKVDINANNNDCQQTPLHLASKLNKEDNIMALLMYNANVALFDDQGKTPLHYCSTKVMELFLCKLSTDRQAVQNLMDIEKGSHSLSIKNRDLWGFSKIVVRKPHLAWNRIELAPFLPTVLIFDRKWPQ